MINFLQLIFIRLASDPAVCTDLILLKQDAVYKTNHSQTTALGFPFLCCKTQFTADESIGEIMTIIDRTAKPLLHSRPQVDRKLALDH